MEYTRLGSSGLKVSRIALGCMSFSKPGTQFDWALDTEDAEPIFRQAIDLGITFWDTANVYGEGSSEEIVGHAIREYSSREEIVLATKVFGVMHKGPGGSGLSRKAIIEQFDASLKRLNVDYVDLLQIHRFDPETPVEETMEALHDVVKAGKARYIGASSMWAWQFSKMQYTAQLNGWTKFISMQDQYGLTSREEEREMFALLADEGVGSIPWSPLNGGINARPWGDKSTTRGAGRRNADFYGNPLWIDSDKAIIDAIEKVAIDRGVSMAQIALAWVFKNPIVDSVLAGPTKPHHLADAVAALEIELTPEEISSLEEHYVPRKPTFFA
jgi:aryl-alcohol dehydrogenase-like predicted oxidoreductase